MMGGAKSAGQKSAFLIGRCVIQRGMKGVGHAKIGFND